VRLYVLIFVRKYLRTSSSVVRCTSWSSSYYVVGTSYYVVGTSYSYVVDVRSHVVPRSYVRRLNLYIVERSPSPYFVRRTFVRTYVRSYECSYVSRTYVCSYYVVRTSSYVFVVVRLRRRTSTFVLRRRTFVPSYVRGTYVIVRTWYVRHRTLVVVYVLRHRTS